MGEFASVPIIVRLPENNTSVMSGTGKNKAENNLANNEHLRRIADPGRDDSQARFRFPAKRQWDGSKCALPAPLARLGQNSNHGTRPRAAHAVAAMERGPSGLPAR